MTLFYNKFWTITGSTVTECGLFVDKEHPFLCTSPDGLVGEDGLIEIKCPFTAKDASVLDGDALKVVGIQNGQLKPIHKYFHQIQGQLNITQRKWCDLVVWCLNDVKIFRIERDLKFWDEILPKLKYFYISCILPELVNPRHPRKLPIREPSRTTWNNSYLSHTASHVYIFMVSYEVQICFIRNIFI